MDLPKSLFVLGWSSFFKFYYDITLLHFETYSTKLIEDNPSHKKRDRIDNYYDRNR